MPAGSAVQQRCVCALQQPAAPTKASPSVVPNASPWYRPEKTTQDGKEKHLDKAVKWITHQYISISTYLILCFLFSRVLKEMGNRHTPLQHLPPMQRCWEISQWNQISAAFQQEPAKLWWSKRESEQHQDNRNVYLISLRGCLGLASQQSTLHYICVLQGDSSKWKYQEGPRMPPLSFWRKLEL